MLCRDLLLVQNCQVLSVEILSIKHQHICQTGGVATRYGQKYENLLKHVTRSAFYIKDSFVFLYIYCYFCDIEQPKHYKYEI